jgi:hypothetical protein
VLSAFTRSSAWKSIIERRFSNAKICWALDIDDVLAEVAGVQHRPVIIELTANQLESDCRKVLLASNHPCQARFFAVGSSWLEDYLAAVRSSGFVDACCSIAQFDHLQRLIHRQFQHAATLDLSVEEQVIESLPWKPIRNQI